MNDPAIAGEKKKKAAARENRCVDSASGTVSSATLPRGFIPFQQEHQDPRQNRIQLHIKAAFFFQDGQLRGTVLISTEMQPAGKQNYLVWADECLCFLQDISTAIRGRGDGGELRGFLCFLAKNILPNMRGFQLGISSSPPLPCWVWIDEIYEVSI